MALPGTWRLGTGIHCDPEKRVCLRVGLVVLAQTQDQRLIDWIESKLETRMGLVINRENTSVVNLNDPENGLNFLGFTFRYCRDLKGRGTYYLNVTPSKKALARERDKLREMTGAAYCWMPIPTLIERLNKQLRGWANYFSFGYPRMAMREINQFVRSRLVAHLGRRSQRRYRPPKDVSLYQHLSDLGLVYL